MWLGDFYIKPLHLLLIIAAVILIAVIFIVKKLIAVIITFVILGICVLGGNKLMIKNQAENIANYLDAGKDLAGIGINKIKSLISKEDLSIKDNEVKVKLDGEWLNLDKIRENIIIEGEEVFVKLGDKKIKVETDSLKKLLGEIAR